MSKLLYLKCDYCSKEAEYIVECKVDEISDFTWPNIEQKLCCTKHLMILQLKRNDLFYYQI